MKTNVYSWGLHLFDQRRLAMGSFNKCPRCGLIDVRRTTCSCGFDGSDDSFAAQPAGGFRNRGRRLLSWRRVVSRILACLGALIVLFGLTLPIEVYFSMLGGERTVIHHFTTWAFGSSLLAATALLAAVLLWLPMARSWSALLSFVGLGTVVYGWYTHWKSIVVYNQVMAQTSFASMDVGMIGPSWLVFAFGFLITLLACLVAPPLPSSS
jgi:hypothetical protein